MVNAKLNQTGLAFTYRHAGVKPITDLPRLFSFPVRGMLAAKPAVLVKFKLIRRRALIFGCRVISSFAFCAC